MPSSLPCSAPPTKSSISCRCPKPVSANHLPFMLLPDDPASEERLEKRVLFSVKAGDLTVFGKSDSSQAGKMSATVIEIENLAAASFPKEAGTHWVTENRVRWNEEHSKADKCELVYEASWVSELNARQKLSAFEAVVVRAVH